MAHPDNFADDLARLIDHATDQMQLEQLAVRQVGQILARSAAVRAELLEAFGHLIPTNQPVQQPYAPAPYMPPQPQNAGYTGYPGDEAFDMPAIARGKRQHARN